MGIGQSAAKRGTTMPTIQWTEERIADALREHKKQLGRLPRANELPAGFVKSAQQRFGSWNKALVFAFGEITQARYGELSDKELLAIIRKFVEKHQRLPLRSEFDGKQYPYFETYTLRFNKQRWADILALVDLTGLTYYANKHGFGRVYRLGDTTYLSREEYLIGKYLTEQGIVFHKEVPYNNANFVFDFYLPQQNVYIEYYGIATAAYKETIERKRSCYAGRKVIEIFKHDNTVGKLALEVQRL